MQYRPLGRTGIKVSPYALGTLMFASSVGNPDHEDSIRVIHKALDAGINFVDTADAYGDSEEVVGKALRGRRDTDIEQTLSALSDLIHSGKVRAIGSSGLPASDIVESHWVADRRGLERFHTEQPPYSILNRAIEREVLPSAQRHGMGVLVWGPLGQGMLTGRVRKGQETDVIRARFFNVSSDERRLDAVERLIGLAEEAGLPMTHLAIAFAITHPAVTSAIIGPRTMSHLDDLLAGIEVTLTDDIFDRIDEIVPPGADIGTLDQAYVPRAIQLGEGRCEGQRRPRRGPQGCVGGWVNRAVRLGVTQGRRAARRETPRASGRRDDP